MSVTDLFPIDPDYPVAVDILDGVLRQQSHDGRQFARPLRADRRQFRLEFRSRPTTELQQIIAWQRRMRDQVFLFEHRVWERGSWNLLGLDAEAEHQTVNEYRYNRFKRLNVAVTLAELGLKVGDPFSFGGDVKVENAADSIWFRLAFSDIDEGVVSAHFSPTSNSLTYVESKLEGLVIPAGTVALDFRGENTGMAGDHFFKNARINRAPALEPIKAPFTNEAYVPRFFPVRFAAPVRHRLAAHESHDIEVDLIEVVGVTLDEVHHPDPLDLSTSTSFLEETEGTALVGSWTDPGYVPDAHGGGERNNVNTNTADEFAFTYSGYGFRLWARKDTDLGICKVLLDDVDLGNVDLYAAAAADSAALLTKLDVALGLHTVKVRATNTKNGSSSANTIVADAVEFMP